MIVAAIDCGTNTVRLLVRADKDEQLVREVTITRLGEGVDESGRLSEEALKRTVTAIAGYADNARELQAERIAIVATSAARDAANADEFRRAVTDATGMSPWIVPGEVEAELSFAGAAKDSRDRVAVVDVGGGSTEIIVGQDGAPHRSVSMQLGSVRCTERYDLRGIVSEDALNRLDETLRKHVRTSIEGWDVAGRELIAVAATATSLAALDAELDAYDSSIIQGRRVSTERVEELRHRLAGIDGAHRLKAFPVLTPGREDVIVAGASVLLAVMREVGVGSFTASEADILDGIALWLETGRPFSE